VLASVDEAASGPLHLVDRGIEAGLVGETEPEVVDATGGAPALSGTSLSVIVSELFGGLRKTILGPSRNISSRPNTSR
jgi:hypothetical protein